MEFVNVSNQLSVEDVLADTFPLLEHDSIGTAIEPISGIPTTVSLVETVTNDCVPQRVRPVMMMHAA